MSHRYYEQTESFSEEMDPLSVFLEKNSAALQIWRQQIATTITS